MEGGSASVFTTQRAGVTYASPALDIANDARREDEFFPALYKCAANHV
jgi:hypothetical protein